MVFTTPVFFFAFLPAVLVLFFASPRRVRLLTLTLASFVFYGWWRPDFVLLMIASAVVDYTAGWKIAGTESPRKRKLWLLLSMVTNLGLLGFFKYANFGIDSFNRIVDQLGLDLPEIGLASIVLPVGISFYTFQSMSYTIDVYRRQIGPEKDFLLFLCYVSLFPQLVAGPIVRFRDVTEQLHARRFSLSDASKGALYFQLGFAKKVLIADSIAPIAERAFAMDSPGFGDAWLGSLAYTYQIYFDFSGYSDMAIGLGLILGLRFPVNFDSPYKSQSITEFWRRWHISLSSWLRDYLYIPLGGNQKGPRRTYVNLMLTMLLGGLWHGAAWTFVAWGAYQGAWLALERMNGKKPYHHRLPKPARIFVTLVIAVFGWVLFKASSMDQAAGFLQAMLGLSSASPHVTLDPTSMEVRVLLLAAAIAWGLPNTQEIIERRSKLVLAPLATAFFVLAIGQIWFQTYRPFLYFQF